MRTTFSSFLFSPFSLYFCLCLLVPVLLAANFFRFQKHATIAKKRCLLWKELELAARGGTRKQLRRATRKRRPMDVHVFVSLTQRLGFGHQSGPKFPFGKPHDQKSKKNRPPLSNDNLFLLRRFICFLFKRKKVLNPQLAARRRTHVLICDACKP